MGVRERRTREKGQRKNQILDAARALLFKKGLASTSVNQIAKLSELGIGTIYFYYASKEEIYADLQEEGLDLMHKNISLACRGGRNPMEKVKRIAMGYLRFSEENRDYFDIINYFISTPQHIFPPGLKEEIDQSGNRILELLEKSITEGIESGDFDEIDPRRHAVMIWSSLHGLIQFKKLRQTILKNVDYSSLYEYTVDYYINSMIKK